MLSSSKRGHGWQNCDKKNKMVANAVIFLLTADRDAVVPQLEEQDDNDSDES